MIALGILKPTSTLGFVSLGVALLGLLIVLAGLFRDRSKGRRRCPKCWFSLQEHVFDGRGSIVCPECGHTVDSMRRLHRTRRSWRLVILGVPILVVGLVYPKVERDGPASILPMRVLTLLDDGGALDWCDDQFTRQPMSHWVAVEVNRRLQVGLGDGAINTWMRHVAAELEDVGEQTLDPSVRAMHESLASTTLPFDWASMLPSDVTAPVGVQVGNARPYTPRGSLTMSIEVSIEEALMIQMSSLQMEASIPRSQWSPLHYVDAETIVAGIPATQGNLRRVHDLQPLLEAASDRFPLVATGDDSTELSRHRVFHELQKLCRARVNRNPNQFIWVGDRWLLVQGNLRDHLVLEDAMRDLEELLRSGVTERGRGLLERSSALSDRLASTPCPIRGSFTASDLRAVLDEAGFNVVVDAVPLEFIVSQMRTTPMLDDDSPSMLDALRALDDATPSHITSCWDDSYGAVILADDRAVQVMRRMYDVAALNAAFRTHPPASASLVPGSPDARVQSLIRSLVHPAMWSRNPGKRGSMIRFGDEMMIQASPRLHRDVERFLDELSAVLDGRWSEEERRRAAWFDANGSVVDPHRRVRAFHDCSALAPVLRRIEDPHALRSLLIVTVLRPSMLEIGRGSPSFVLMSIPDILCADLPIHWHLAVGDLIDRIARVIDGATSEELLRLEQAPDDGTCVVIVHDIRSYSFYDSDQVGTRLMERLRVEFPEMSSMPRDQVVARRLGPVLVVRAPVELQRVVPRLVRELGLEE